MDEMQYLGNMFDKIPEPERQKIREYYIGKNSSISSPIIHGSFKTALVNREGTTKALSLAVILLAEQCDNLYNLILKESQFVIEPIIVKKG